MDVAAVGVAVSSVASHAGPEAGLGLHACTSATLTRTGEKTHVSSEISKDETIIITRRKDLGPQ